MDVVLYAEVPRDCATYTVSQKNVTTSSTISWTRIVRLPQFLAHLLPRV